MAPTHSKPSGNPFNLSDKPQRSTSHRGTWRPCNCDQCISDCLVNGMVNVHRRKVQGTTRWIADTIKIGGVEKISAISGELVREWYSSLAKGDFNMFADLIRKGHYRAATVELLNSPHVFWEMPNDDDESDSGSVTLGDDDTEDEEEA